jgi:hypothetical protein
MAVCAKLKKADGSKEMWSNNKDFWQTTGDLLTPFKAEASCDLES